MRVTKDRCINSSCGTRDRSAAIPFRNLPYWWCSTECRDETIHKYVREKRFLGPIEKDEEVMQAYLQIKEDHAQRFHSIGLLDFWKPEAWDTEDAYTSRHFGPIVRAWNAAREAAFHDAEDEVYRHLSAEWEYQEQEELQKEAKEAEAMEKKRAQELQKEVAAMEKKRAETKKREEERAAREAEEERWRPRPFKL